MITLRALARNVFIKFGLESSNGHWADRFGIIMYKKNDQF